MNYQDNALVKVNTEDGHKVLIVSDCNMFEDGIIVPAPPGRTRLSNGADLVRLEFDSLGISSLTKKIKICSRLSGILDEFRPDVILYHGVIGWAMKTAAAYKKNNKNVKFYIDSHEDFHNSATNWISEYFQYKLFTRYVVRSINRDIDKIFYISSETRDFLIKLLKVPESLLEFYPLGGIVIDEAERAQLRAKQRHTLAIRDDQIVFLHSGKLDFRKRTADVLQAFADVTNPDCILLIVGMIPSEMENIIRPLITGNPRVRFLGWKSAFELIQIMCASDAYIQPGGQSASLQNAICCGLPVLVHPYPSHVPYIEGNGYFVSNRADITRHLAEWVGNPTRLKDMSAAAYLVARRLLDYRKLGARLYR